MEALAKAFDPALVSQALQGFAHGCGGNGQRGLHFRAIKTVKAMTLEIIEEVGNPFIFIHDVLIYAEKDGFRLFFNFQAHNLEWWKLVFSG